MTVVSMRCRVDTDGSLLMLKMLIYCISEIPLRPTKDMQVSVTSGTLNINRSGAGSIEVEELKGTTIASNKSLSKVERKKKSTYNSEQ